MKILVIVDLAVMASGLGCGIVQWVIQGDGIAKSIIIAALTGNSGRVANPILRFGFVALANDTQASVTIVVMALPCGELAILVGNTVLNGLVEYPSGKPRGVTGRITGDSRALIVPTAIQTTQLTNHGGIAVVVILKLPTQLHRVAMALLRYRPQFAVLLGEDHGSTIAHAAIQQFLRRPSIGFGMEILACGVTFGHRQCLAFQRLDGYPGIELVTGNQVWCRGIAFFQPFSTGEPAKLLFLAVVVSIVIAEASNIGTASVVYIQALQHGGCERHYRLPRVPLCRITQHLLHMGAIQQAGGLADAVANAAQ